MASLNLLSLFSLAFLFLSSATSFLLPILKDNDRPQYMTSFQIGTPPVRIYLTLDLGNPTTWFLGTAAGYNYSSTFKPILVNTTECIAYFGSDASFMEDCPWAGPGPRTPLCNNGQCMGWATNPRYLNFSYNVPNAGLDPTVVDIMTPIYRRDSTSKATLLRFPFVDTTTTGPLKDLSQYSKGILTLARNAMAIHSQISSVFKVPRKFAICLPSSSSTLNGVVYFGGGPYILPPSKVELSANMVSTKLLNNTFVDPNEPGSNPPGEYYFKINSIEIDGSPAKFNPTLMSFDKQGNGGAKLSTMAPYTTLRSEIYKAFINVFLLKAKALKMTVVKPVAPFKTCFSTGSGIPLIEIVMDGNQRWKIYGSNSMVEVSKTVKCLGIFDGGVKSNGGVFPSVVIGGKQMEDSLVELDLEASKMKVASSLQRFGTSCSQFKGI